MKLVITHTLAKREFGKDAVAFDEVVAAWRKGVFTELPSKRAEGGRLLKAYVTTARGPRRTLFLLQHAGTTFFLMHRAKGDRIGDNMSHKNPRFAEALTKALEIAFRDIEAGAFSTIER